MIPNLQVILVLRKPSQEYCIICCGGEIWKKMSRSIDNNVVNVKQQKDQNQNNINLDLLMVRIRFRELRLIFRAH